MTTSNSSWGRPPITTTARSTITLYYRDESILPGYPQIANLDGDPEPEIIIINNDGGITILEHDGTIKNQDMTPTGDPAGFGAWFRPSTVHDFDGDGVS